MPGFCDEDQELQDTWMDCKLISQVTGTDHSIFLKTEVQICLKPLLSITPCSRSYLRYISTVLNRKPTHVLV